MITLPQETRQVGRHHQWLLRDRGSVELHELQFLGVRKAHEVPSRERIGHGEAQHHVAIAIGQQVREEEGRFAEVGAQCRATCSRLGRVLCFTIVLSLLSSLVHRHRCGLGQPVHRITGDIGIAKAHCLFPLAAPETPIRGNFDNVRFLTETSPSSPIKRT